MKCANSISSEPVCAITRLAYGECHTLRIRRQQLLPERIDWSGEASSPLRLRCPSMIVNVSRISGGPRGVRQLLGLGVDVGGRPTLGRARPLLVRARAPVERGRSANPLLRVLVRAISTSPLLRVLVRIRAAVIGRDRKLV